MVYLRLVSMLSVFKCTLIPDKIRVLCYFVSEIKIGECMLCRTMGMQINSEEIIVIVK